ncbi:MAG: EVE domain-containing protein [Acidobacteriota bacterium]
MSFWLLKTEPGAYSFADLERAGSTVWDGVTSNVALKYMRDARRGDRAIVYHSGSERAAIGIAAVTSNPYPDPSAADPHIVVFRLEPIARLARPVTLAEIKADRTFADSPLVRMPRLSVSPLTGEQWRRLESLAAMRPR